MQRESRHRVIESDILEFRNDYILKKLQHLNPDTSMTAGEVYQWLYKTMSR